MNTKLKGLFMAFGFLVLTGNVFAELKCREGFVNSFAPWRDESVKISLFDTFNFETYPIAKDALVYDKDGKVFDKSQHSNFIDNRLFVILDNSSGDYVATELYMLPRDYIPGTYEGPGTQRHPEFKSTSHQIEGYARFLFGSDKVYFCEFGEDENTEYLTYQYIEYLDENENKTTSLNMLNGGKFRATVAKVNDSLIMTKIQKLPPQYEPRSSKGKASNEGSKGSNGGKSSRDDDDDWESSDSGWDEEEWDGWSDGESATPEIEVDIAFGYVKNFSQGNRTITITRKDGKYRNFPVDDDVKIYNKKGKKCMIAGIGFGTHVRYITTVKEGKPVIVDIRAIPDDAPDYDEEPNFPENAESAYVTPQTYNAKKNTFSFVWKYNNKQVIMTVSEDIKVYDKYSREIGVNEIFFCSDADIVYTKNGDEYVVYEIRCRDL